MTCIIGIANGDTIWIGGDSAALSGDCDLHILPNEKVFRSGVFIFGFCRSFRMGQLLRYSLKLPRHHEDDDIGQFMATGFIDAVRECFKVGGWAKTENGTESGGQFLVGYAGQLFSVQPDYHVKRVADGVAAIGAGFAYALGSLQETTTRAPRDRIKRALAAAERLSAGVRGPFVIKSITKKETPTCSGQ